MGLAEWQADHACGRARSGGPDRVRERFLFIFLANERVPERRCGGFGGRAPPMLAAGPYYSVGGGGITVVTLLPCTANTTRDILFPFDSRGLHACKKRKGGGGREVV